MRESPYTGNARMLRANHQLTKVSQQSRRGVVVRHNNLGQELLCPLLLVAKSTRTSNRINMLVLRSASIISSITRFGRGSPFFSCSASSPYPLEDVFRVFRKPPLAGVVFRKIRQRAQKVLDCAH